MVTLNRNNIRVLLAAILVSFVLVMPVAGTVHAGDCPTTSSGSCAG